MVDTGLMRKMSSNIPIKLSKEIRPKCKIG